MPDLKKSVNIKCQEIKGRVLTTVKTTIDSMYGKLCGTSPLNKETPSNLHEDEEWIDLTFKEMLIQPYSAWNPSISLVGDLSTVQLEKITGDSYSYQKKTRELTYGSDRTIYCIPNK